MASIHFDNLKKTSTVANIYTYSDLHLDFVIDNVNRDLVLDYDDEAIKNSIINIFNTVPGERFLIPKFGCNLLQYLFQPVTEFTANVIAQTIFNAIILWEPRVSIANLSVTGNPDAHEYVIDLTLVFPKLKKQTNLGGILTQEGFTRI